MGNLFSRRKGMVLLIGLDNAGKSSIVRRLANLSNPQPLAQTIPTIGLDLQEVRFGKVTFKMWDVGGQQETRTVWRHYFTGMQGLVYVVDASAEDRFPETSLELAKIFRDPQLSGMPTLVLANKMDLQTARSAAEVAGALHLQELGHTYKLSWRIQPCSAKTGVGVAEGFQWLSDNMKKK